MSEKAINYVREYLIDEINRTELTEQTCESIDEGIIYGRKELAEILLQRLIGFLEGEESNE
tara:strand:+ start:613 stop:795 length:183 start_codon:yes stop_codon:yes gene_type:complete